MGLHQDKDEGFSAPVVSVSLSNTAIFRVAAHRAKTPHEIRASPATCLFGRRG
jgi:alkylated DNA repair dioxygenase AlkB